MADPPVAEKVGIAIHYNGGFPRYHWVSAGFYERLMNLLATKWSHLDVVVNRLDKGRDFVYSPPISRSNRGYRRSPRTTRRTG